jgi:hypothetical protein
VVEHLPSKREALSSNPSNDKKKKRETSCHNKIQDGIHIGKEKINSTENIRASCLGDCFLYIYTYTQITTQNLICNYFSHNTTLYKQGIDSLFSLVSLTDK